MPEVRLEQYAKHLSSLNREQMLRAFARAAMECNKFPSVAELRDLAGVTDGRVGADEAWAICPVSEDQTVVWTPEIRRAFDAARELRNAGDEIAARMAFRSAYERELQQARASGEPVRWEASLGWKKAERVVPVAEAVQAGRITQEEAFRVTAEDQHAELAGLLPGSTAPQLKGKVEVELPGFYGVLQQMRMAGTVPEGCDPKKPVERPGGELSEEQLRQRREMLKAQGDAMKKRFGGAA